jgi:hypothetical protein
MTPKPLDTCCQALLLLFISVSLTGCKTFEEYSLTGKLWNNSELRSFAEPAEDPHLELCFKKPDDVFVIYDEVLEQDEKTRRRAYFLAKNVDRIARNQKPRFASPKAGSKLTRIDMLPTAGKTNSIPYAIYKRDSRQFSLIGVRGLEGTHDLPVYMNNSGSVTCVALTPLAVASDATVITIAAAFVAGYAYASGLVHH